MKKLIIALFATMLLGSCTITMPSSSRFPKSNISLGMEKEAVIKMFGSPFRTDLSMDKDSNKKEILYYKEPTFVKGYNFVITTALHFTNGKLVKMEQTDRSYDNQVVVRDSI